MTTDERKQLREYVKKAQQLLKREPERLPTEEWDKAWPTIQETGIVPEEFRDRIGVTENIIFTDVVNGKNVKYPNGRIQKGYYDIVWENWNSECQKLRKEYHDVIHSAICLLISDPNYEESNMSFMEQLAYISSLPEIGTETDKIDFAVDKVSSNFFKVLEKTNDGQIGLMYPDPTDPTQRDPGKESILYEKRDMAAKQEKEKGIVVPLLYSLDFSDLPVPANIDAYDRRVYTAVGSLYVYGTHIMTIQQIYNAMGYSGRVGQSDIDNIRKSIEKFSVIRLHLDNTKEAEAYNYDKFVVTENLLYSRTVDAIRNGCIVHGAVQIIDEPVLQRYARMKNQITTFNVKILNSGLNKTQANLKLEDYFIERIAHMKRDLKKKHSYDGRMLFDTIYERAEITTKKQKQRAPAKIIKLLDHYTSKEGDEWIKGYKMDETGVTIIL